MADLQDGIPIVACDRIESPDQIYAISGTRIYRCDATTGETTELAGAELERVRRWILRRGNG